jgi:hypothetical protein
MATGRPPDTDTAQIERICADYIRQATEVWERAFTCLGLSFNAKEFQDQAAGAMDHVIRSALFHGAGLTLEDASRLDITRELMSVVADIHLRRAA